MTNDDLISKFLTILGIFVTIASLSFITVELKLILIVGTGNLIVTLLVYENLNRRIKKLEGA